MYAHSELDLFCALCQCKKKKKKALEGLLKSLKKSCLVCASVILKVAAKCRLVERRSPLKALGGA